MDSTATVKPIAVYRSGAIQGAVFKNPKGLSISVSKSYKDKDGNWKRQRFSVFEGDLPNLLEIVGNISADKKVNFVHN